LRRPETPGIALFSAFFTGDYLACATLNDATAAGVAPHDAQFLICGRCGAAPELHDPTLARALLQSAERFGFKAREASVEVVGVCAACRSA
jgi:Fe2+ or Zn2+ uptake regulation protein